jgi:hypothetical protein
MTVINTLEVVHGLFNNVKEARNGAPQVFLAIKR